MATYLLLRDNKQTGPHSFEEMLELGFRKYDLVWVEGKSAAWRYPGEISEFKDHAPLVEEQPYDRFFKRKTAPATEAAVAVNTIQPESLPEAVPISVAPIEALASLERIHISDENLVSENDGVLHANPMQEANRSVPTSHPNQDIERVATVREGLKPRRVAITMPANRKSVTVAAGESKKNETPLPQKTSELISLPQPPLDQNEHSHYLPGSATGPVEFAQETKDDEEEELIPLSQIPPKPFSGDYTQYLQYAGVAAALVSLLIVGVLIGKGTVTDSTPLPTPVTQQPSRIDELKKKLYETPVAEPASTEPDYEPELRAEAAAIQVPAKLNASTSRKNITVRTSYKTSSAPPATDGGEKREAIKRVSAPEKENADKTTDLASKLKLSLNDYKVNMFGGIDGIEVTLRNTAPVTVSEAVVELRYILSNRNKKHLTEIVRFKNLKPGESKTLPGPKSARGIRLESSVVSAR